MHSIDGTAGAVHCAVFSDERMREKGYYLSALYLDIGYKAPASSPEAEVKLEGKHLSRSLSLCPLLS